MFGSLNFAGLERIFRSYNFNTYCLAIPEEIADENLIPKLNHVSHVVFLYPGQLIVEKYALEWGFEYNADTNLENLAHAGFMVARAGTPYARQIKGLKMSN